MGVLKLGDDQDTKEDFDDSCSDVSMSDNHDEEINEGESVEEEEEVDEDGETNEDEDSDSDSDVDDEVVQAIKSEKAKKRTFPPTINTEDFIVDICMHPVLDTVAIATIGGDVLLYEYSNKENKLLETYELHTKACRDVEFDIEGVSMFTTAKDKSVVVTDMSTGKLKNCYENAHEDPVYCLKVIDDHKFVTGDDSGTVKLWDLRKAAAVMSVRVGEETVNDLVTTESCKYLACAGADGVLTAIDLKGGKIYASSEEYDSELTCLGLFRSNTKLLAGSSKGKLYFFNWKEFGLHSDEYIGHKESISCMIPITQNVVVTSGQDGVLRAAHMFPHRQLGVVGQHAMPVERLDISNDGRLVASCSHDNDVKFWDMSYFEKMDRIIDVTQKQNKRKDMANNLPSSRLDNASEFFSGLE